MPIYLANIPAPPFDSFGPFRIYGLTMAIAIAVGVLISHKRWIKIHPGSTLILDIFLPVVISGIVGARIYHLFTGYDWDEQGMSGVINLRNGGISIWGAVIGGAIAVGVLSRIKKFSFLELGDTIAPALLIAQAIGRLGNYFNQELFGRELNTFWALKVDEMFRPVGFENVTTFHPTFIYEMVWNIGLALAIIVYQRRSKTWVTGQGLALYVAGYTLFRTFLETVRIDKATQLFGIRFNLMFSASLFILAVLWLIFLRKFHHKTTDTPPRVIILGMTKTFDATAQPADNLPKTVAAKVVHVTKSYGSGEAQVSALDDVTVDFYQGEFTAIMGPSGSGKSTLLHCIAGLDRVSAGEVWLGSTDITRLNERKMTLIRRERLGFIFQSFNLLPMLNAKENIELPLRLARTKIDKGWFERVVATVGLQNRLAHKPSELSGGQQQRVAVARALASKPEIIFADEPTGNLDSKSGSEVLKFMREAVDEHKQTIVMVTHDPVAASYADRVVFLSDGKVVNEMDDPSSGAILDYLKGLG